MSHQFESPASTLTYTSPDTIPQIHERLHIGLEADSNDDDDEWPVSIAGQKHSHHNYVMAPLNVLITMQTLHYLQFAMCHMTF